jgi:predicted dehydrogenase
MIKAAIIGCGRIAGAQDSAESKLIRSHARAYIDHKGFELVACYDKLPERAAAFALIHDIKHHGTDFAGGISQLKPSVVSVCTPDDTHYPITRELLLLPEAPRVIFLEKPACRSEAELDELIRLSTEREIALVVNHSRRFDSRFRELRNMIKQGSFGELVQADLTYYSGWAHNGVHLTDTLDFLFGRKLSILSFDGASPSPYPGDDNLAFTLGLGDASIFIHTFDEKYYQLFEMDFRFTSSRLRLEDFGQRIVLERMEQNELGERVLVRAETGLVHDGLSPLQNAMKEISAFIEGRSLLEGYRINDVRNSMSIIWEGQQWQR